MKKKGGQWVGPSGAPIATKFHEAAQAIMAEQAGQVKPQSPPPPPPPVINPRGGPNSAPAATTPAASGRGPTSQGTGAGPGRGGTGQPAPQKTFPRARLAEFAAANGMTPAQAEAALKAQNYTVQ